MAMTMFLTYLHLAPVITTTWCGTFVVKRSKVNQPYNYFKENYNSLNKHFQEMDWSSRFEGYDINYY